MKAIKTAVTVNEQGQLALDSLLNIEKLSRRHTITSILYLAFQLL